MTLYEYLMLISNTWILQELDKMKQRNGFTQIIAQYSKEMPIHKLSICTLWIKIVIQLIRDSRNPHLFNFFLLIQDTVQRVSHPNTTCC